MNPFETGEYTMEYQPSTLIEVLTEAEAPTIERPKNNRGAPPKIERNKQFAAAYNAGATIDELSAQFGLNHSTTKQYIMKLRRWGLITRLHDPRTQITRERNKHIVSQYHAGVSSQTLSAQYNLTAVQIGQIIHDDKMRTLAGVVDNPLLYVAITLDDAKALASTGIASPAMREACLTAVTLKMKDQPPAAR
jgi:predicted transcriptional regulator